MCNQANIFKMKKEQKVNYTLKKGMLHVAIKIMLKKGMLHVTIKIMLLTNIL